MNNRIELLKNTIEPVRQQIVNHKLFSEISTIEDLRIFMQHHVFAVWDFMSLLKSLQKNLTCTDIPWYPKGSAETRYLINEIVVGEESDVDMNGNRISHFELYLQAMDQSGADASKILSIVNAFKNNEIQSIEYDSTISIGIQNFVNQTFEVIQTNKDYIQAAVFTFGREDLIPNMFYSIVQEINIKAEDQISIFKYYLDRHIEVDGDHHSHLALKMTEELCNEDEAKWDESTRYVIKSLEKRKELWDAILEEIKSKRETLLGV
jgi:hypothetical protein